MEKTWIVVADSARARIFTIDPEDGNLKETQAFEHAMSRAHGKDITTDRPGKGSGGAGNGRYAMGQGKSPKEHEARQFGRQVADAIESGRNRHWFDHIILVAPSSFLGELRNDLSDAAKRMVVKEIVKDLAGLKTDQIQSYLEGDLSLHARLRL